MACYHPLQAWRGRINPDTGKSSIVWKRQDSLFGEEVKLPCGQCIGCRLERSRQWAIRCVHEAQMHESNSFITLTFNQEHLPKSGSVDVRDFQLFMKRLRKKIAPRKVRFFHCGEYGDHQGRPHYHACLFGYDFQDKILWQDRSGVKLYRSKELEELWPFGYSTVGEVTFESAAYVARYIMKKITGEKAVDHYTEYDQETGEIYNERNPEYTTMSRRPGIGSTWYEKFKHDVYPHDFVVLRGRKMRPPKYYDGLYELTEPDEHRQLKRSRTLSAKEHIDNNTPERLNVRERVQKARLKKLPRNHDKETD